MFVKDILAGKPAGSIYSVSSDDTVASAAQMLSAKRIGAVIVSDSADTLNGILSERDIVREIGKSGTGCLSGNVSTLMTAKVQTCGPADPTTQVLERMTEGRFRHMPVLDDGKLVGVISIGDVVAARIQEVEFENNVMVEMFTGQV